MNQISIEEFEMLAVIEHERWSHWMLWLFSSHCGHDNDDGTYTIDASEVTRWKRQLATKYDDLSPNEQMSDKNEVAKTISAIGITIAGKRKE